ncbi:MAG TPA: TIGR02569 family protein [Candidatus Limnocylindrales bacterium]
MTSNAPFGSPPPQDVLAAFGVSGSPTALSGGQGLAWHADDVVLKPADTSEEALAWQARVLIEVPPEMVRVGRPERSTGGTFIVGGWSASVFCLGRHEPRRWSDIIAVGRRLHWALSQVARPEFLASRADPWAVADRAAWGDIPLAPYRDTPHVTQLEAVLAPVRGPSQVIHGDLTGNVLFADDPLPPAVIDLSPYWRPAEFASAIVVADALVWEGARVSELTSAMDIDEFGQLLARALLFRIIADVVVDPDSMDARAAAYAPAVKLAVRLIQDHR